MIVLVTGSPGSGKSYALTRVISQTVEAGKPCATNVPLHPDWAMQLAKGNVFRRMKGQKYLERKARDFERLVFVSESLDDLLRVRLRGEKEGRGVLVLDEVHRWANSRTWDTDEEGKSDKATATRRRLDLVKWFSGHRHYGWDVYLGTQTETNIDRQIRSLFEYILICRNVKRYRVAGIPLVPFNLFIVLWCWNDHARSIVRRQCYPLKKGVARMYATHALSAVDMPPDVLWLPREDSPEPGGDGGGSRGGERGCASPAARRRGTCPDGLVEARLDSCRSCDDRKAVC